MDLGSIHFVIYFFIYSFIGWCLEVLYAFSQQHKFVNRGFLNGPLCPIYGFGALLVVLILTPVSYNWFLLFLTGTLLTSGLEYITGLILEKLFHAKWWDYSHNAFNIQGRICLTYSLLWGGFTLILLLIIHPWIRSVIESIPAQGLIIAAGLLTLSFLIDVLFTVRGVVRFNQWLDSLEKVSQAVKQQKERLELALQERGQLLQEKWEENLQERWESLQEKLEGSLQERWESLQDKLEEGLQHRLESLHEKLDEGLDSLHTRYDQLLSKGAPLYTRLINAFPNLDSHKFKDTLSEVKSKLLKQHKQDKKE